MKGDCGHDVTFIVGRFALCSVKGCDTKPGERRLCGSRDIRPFSAPMVPDGSFHCLSCGRVWHPGY